MNEIVVHKEPTALAGLTAGLLQSRVPVPRWKGSVRREQLKRREGFPRLLMTQCCREHLKDKRESGLPPMPTFQTSVLIVNR